MPHKKYPPIPTHKKTLNLEVSQMGTELLGNDTLNNLTESHHYLLSFDISECRDKGKEMIEEAIAKVPGISTCIDETTKKLSPCITKSNKELCFYLECVKSDTLEDKINNVMRSLENSLNKYYDIHLRYFTATIKERATSPRTVSQPRFGF